MNRELNDVDQVFKALADPTRIRIVGLLLGGEVCVCHIHETLGIPQSKASRHLAYLRKNGIVAGEKRGLWVYYKLAPKKEGIVQILMEASQRCISHLETVQKDATKLAKKTGCCVAVPQELPQVRVTVET
jgi:ArsR family transcriptional regulator